MKARISTQHTPAGEQILAPWAASQMDTITPLRARGTVALPLPLFTQDEDAQARADASRQLTMKDIDL